jgi:hypothetical protein
MLKLPRAELAPTVGRLHARLLECAVADDDQAALRDQALVPALADELARPKPDVALVDDLAGLLALVPEPKDDAARARFTAALGKLEQVLRDHHARAYVARRAAADALRKSPSAPLKKAMFCGAAENGDSENQMAHTDE